MKLYIKYMVSLRCKMVVEAELKNLALPYLSIELGTIALPSLPTAEQREALSIALLRSGLELLDDQGEGSIMVVTGIMVQLEQPQASR